MTKVTLVMPIKTYKSQNNLIERIKFCKGSTGVARKYAVLFLSTTFVFILLIIKSFLMPLRGIEPQTF